MTVNWYNIELGQYRLDDIDKEFCYAKIPRKLDDHEFMSKLEEMGITCFICGLSNVILPPKWYHRGYCNTTMCIILGFGLKELRSMIYDDKGRERISIIGDKVEILQIEDEKIMNKVNKTFIVPHGVDGPKSLEHIGLKVVKTNKQFDECTIILPEEWTVTNPFHEGYDFYLLDSEGTHKIMICQEGIRLFVDEPIYDEGTVIGFHYISYFAKGMTKALDDVVETVDITPYVHIRGQYQHVLSTIDMQYLTQLSLHYTSLDLLKQLFRSKGIEPIFINGDIHVLKLPRGWKNLASKNCESYNDSISDNIIVDYNGELQIQVIGQNLKFFDNNKLTHSLLNGVITEH